MQHHVAGHEYLACGLQVAFENKLRHFLAFSTETRFGPTEQSAKSFPAIKSMVDAVCISSVGAM
jgi:hypothetical protein